LVKRLRDVPAKDCAGISFHRAETQREFNDFSDCEESGDRRCHRRLYLLDPEPSNGFRSAIQLRHPLAQRRLVIEQRGYPLVIEMLRIERVENRLGMFPIFFAADR
jgi:hypothetical protein